MSDFATYTKHHRNDPEGHIFLDKDGACTITLTGASAMSQEELDHWGGEIAKLLSEKQVAHLRGMKETL